LAGITLAQAEAQLASYLEAETAILSGGQAKSHKGRSLQQAGLAEVRAGIEYWDSKVRSLGGTGAGKIQHRRVVPQI